MQLCMNSSTNVFSSIGYLHVMGIPHQLVKRMVTTVGLKLMREDSAQEKKSDNILGLDVLRTPFLALGVGVGILSLS